jgi:hypothetical protein
MAVVRAQLVRAGTVLGAPLTAVIFTVVAKGTQFAVTARLKAETGTDEVAICDANGKIKSYTSIDDFLTAATKSSLITSMSPIAYSFDNVVALEPAVFTGDIIAKTERLIASYQAQVLTATDAIANANTVLSLLPASTAGEVAYKAEKTAQRDAIVSLKTWLSSEVTRLTALLPTP